MRTGRQPSESRKYMTAYFVFHLSILSRFSLSYDANFNEVGSNMIEKSRFDLNHEETSRRFE